jgi:ribosome biogenesis GTPase
VHADEDALRGLGLSRLGFTAADAAAHAALLASSSSNPLLAEAAPARVVVEHRDRYELVTADAVVVAELAGHLRRLAKDPLAKPAVGDWVLVGAGRAPRIEAVLPRRTALVRKAAGRRARPQVVVANVDVVVVVTAAGADVNVRRLERYATAIADSGARPVVVLTKVDLEGEGDVVRIQEAWPGARVIAASGLTGLGVAAVRAELAEGVTGALVGSSGVGKSTLVNALVGRELHATAEVRASDLRGRHTTTFRALVPLPGPDGGRGGGGLLVDSPGMRELSAWDADEGVRATFGDVEALLGACRYSDCRHAAEPGCAVQAALASGELDPARYEAFQVLLEEQAAQAEAATPEGREAKRRAIKALTRGAKVRAAEKRGRR